MLRIFAVYDVKAEVFNSPFFLRTVGEAIRGFTDAVNGGESMLSKYPEDYSLFEVGSFDQVSGVIASREPFRVVGGLEVRSGREIKAVV